MFYLRHSLRRAVIYQNAVTNYANLRMYQGYTTTLQTKKPNKVSIRSLTTEKGDPRRMIDPKHIVHYNEVLTVINEPQKVLIDVRNPDEVNATGMIPSSINIPLPEVPNVLDSMSREDFRKLYKRDKPTENDEIIFYCQSGRRAALALVQALKLGYSKSKSYEGSWMEWSSKQNL